jgi:hypothetical protein
MIDSFIVTSPLAMSTRYSSSAERMMEYRRTVIRPCVGVDDGVSRVVIYGRGVMVRIPPPTQRGLKAPLRLYGQDFTPTQQAGSDANHLVTDRDSDADLSRLNPQRNLVG